MARWWSLRMAQRRVTMWFIDPMLDVFYHMLCLLSNLCKRMMFSCRMIPSLPHSFSKVKPSDFMKGSAILIINEFVFTIIRDLNHNVFFELFFKSIFSNLFLDVCVISRWFVLSFIILSIFLWIHLSDFLQLFLALLAQLLFLLFFTFCSFSLFRSRNNLKCILCLLPLLSLWQDL